MKTLWGLFLVILQMQVWGGIEEICARYTRPFTLLAMGVSVEQLAIKHPESVFVFFWRSTYKAKKHDWFATQAAVRGVGKACIV